jgi:hypothetical protein
MISSEIENDIFGRCPKPDQASAVLPEITVYCREIECCHVG